MRFNDYAHLVWVAILIAAVSMLLEDWQIVPMLAAVEVISFYYHVKLHHPNNAFARVSVLVTGLGVGVLGSQLRPLSPLELLILVGQVTFSELLHLVVHDHDAGRVDRRIWTIPISAFGFIGAIAIALFIHFR